MELPSTFIQPLLIHMGRIYPPKSFHNCFLIWGDPRGIVNRIKKWYDWMAISTNPNSSLKKSAACFASDKQSCKIFVSGEGSPPPFRFLGKKVVGASQTHAWVIKPILFVPSTPFFFFSPVRPMAWWTRQVYTKFKVQLFKLLWSKPSSYFLLW